MKSHTLIALALLMTPVVSESADTKLAAADVGASVTDLRPNTIEMLVAEIKREKAAYGRMPGADSMDARERLLFALAEEVVRLRAETDRLREELQKQK